MRVVMALRNQAELTQLLADLQDPASSDYHHWITPDEFTARFGPTPEDLAQVSAWLTQEGFTVISASASDRLVRFTGSAGQAENAFQTSFAATPDGHYFANLATPAVPANLAGLIQSIVGPVRRLCDTSARSQANRRCQEKRLRSHGHVFLL
jgi:kumamolisin